MIKMDYNFHTHTYRCHHASGAMEEYVLRAIEGGVKHMGFSDHAPFRYPDGHEAPYRVKISEVGDYFADAAALREKYRDKIDIKTGFEMEYLEPYFDRMLREAVGYGAEYLILGQHYIGNGYPLTRSAYYGTRYTEAVERYVKSTVKAMETGVFSYIAHPDILKYTGTDMDVYKTEMRKICKAATRLNMPLEINFLGIREKRNYPCELFWQIAGEEGSPVTFGFDAHRAEDGYDSNSLVVAEEMVRKYGLNYIGKPRLLAIN